MTGMILGHIIALYFPPEAGQAELNGGFTPKIRAAREPRSRCGGKD
ncbi:MAG: hypothetical protein LBB77_02665 [Treponema sp.]|nr:hypothetical protein [Treponema sp.]